MRTPDPNPQECMLIQAYGTRACEDCGDLYLTPNKDGKRPCLFNYEGEPAICGGRRFKRLIKEDKFPKGGSLKARWFVKGMDYANEQNRISQAALNRKSSSRSNLIGRIWDRIGHWS